MRRIFRLVVCVAGFLWCSFAIGQQYEESAKGVDARGTPGWWNGEHTFSSVLCVKFPRPEGVFRLMENLYNGNAIYLVRAEYVDKMIASVTSSTMPPGRTVEQEIPRLAEVERAAERSYGHSYNISEFSTAFGPTIGLRIRDVSPGGRNGPFPLVRALYRPAKLPIESVSVHRLFARGVDRFEVAVLQLAPDGATDRTEVDMTERTTWFADQLVKSLQECTGTLPVRIAQ
jgi:hypothetical protein